MPTATVRKALTQRDLMLSTYLPLSELHKKVDELFWEATDRLKNWAKNDFNNNTANGALELVSRIALMLDLYPAGKKSTDPRAWKEITRSYYANAIDFAHQLGRHGIGYKPRILNFH